MGSGAGPRGFKSRKELRPIFPRSSDSAPFVQQATPNVTPLAPPYQTAPKFPRPLSQIAIL